MTKTTTQQMMDTGKRPAPHRAATIPAARAKAPAAGDWVASTMAGNVITASVTYGT